MPHESDPGPTGAASLIPRPRTRTTGGGSFTLDPSTTVVADSRSRAAAELLLRVLRPSTGLPLDATDATGPAAIVLRVSDDDRLPTRPGGDRSEAFRLAVRPAGIEIVGGGPAGAFYGSQALLQLLPAAALRAARISEGPWTVPAVEVEDAPAFGWRGLMLDVARNFRTKREVMRLIDQLAAHRINRLHLHLTDDQGWRVEIRAHPRLTEIGSWRRESQIGAHMAGADGVPRPTAFDGRPHGGFYTQDDIREIVAYAADRFVTVVPEIEAPGHVRAALAAYPALGVTGEPVEVWTEWGICHDILNAEESTIRFFEEILDEVMDLFPSEYIGIGGDECPKDQWENDARTQERMRELGLADGEQMQAWIMGRLAAHVESRGRRAFGWDEILEGGTVSRSAAVVSWRGLRGAAAAARRGHDVISAPDDRVYLDYRQSDQDAEPIPVGVVNATADVYGFDPVPAELTAEEAAHVIGGQGNLWSEHVDSVRALEYLLFPRLAALAEALWSADVAGPRDHTEFEGRLVVHLARLAAIGVEYRPADGPRPWQQRPGVPGRPSSREAREAQIASLTRNITD